MSLFYDKLNHIKVSKPIPKEGFDGEGKPILPNAGMGENYLLLQHKATVYHQVPEVDTKYTKENESGYPVEMSQEEKDQYDLDYAKSLKEAEINNATHQAIISGYEYPIGSGKIHRFDDEGQRNLIALRSMAITGDITKDIRMTCVDGSFVTVSKDDVLLFTALGFKHKDDLLEQNKLDREAVRACNTIEELESL